MNDAVEHWLTAFRSDPIPTLHDLIMGRAVVPLWSQATLREVFLEILAAQDAPLDRALAGWVAEYLGKPTPPRTPEAVWSSHLQDVFQGAAELPLPEFERLLRQRLDEIEAWLKPLRLAENCDPLLAAYRDLAWGHTNQDLEQRLWRPMVLRQIQTDPSYTDIGLLGFIRARDAQAKLPAKPTDLLLDTILDLADSGIERQKWEATTRSVMAGYMLGYATWARLFQLRLSETGAKANAASWVTQLFGEAIWEATKASLRAPKNVAWGDSGIVRLIREADLREKRRALAILRHEYEEQKYRMESKITLLEQSIEIELRELVSDRPDILVSRTPDAAYPKSFDRLL